MDINSTICLIIFLSTLYPGYYLGVFNFKVINYYTIIYWIPLVFCLIGSFLIYWGIADKTFFISPIAQSKVAKAVGLYIITLSFSSFFWTAFFTEIVLNNFFIKKINWLQYRDLKVNTTQKTIPYILVLFTILMVLYYIISISPSPLYLSLTGASPNEIAIRRLNVTKYYEGVGYFKTLALTLTNIISYAYFAKILSIKKQFPLKIAIAILIVLNIILLALNGEKAPSLFYVIGLLFIYTNIREINLIKITLFGITFLLIVITLYIILFKFNDLNYLVYIIIERVFIAQVASVFYSADYFQTHSFIYLEFLNNPITKFLLLENPQPISETFMYYYLPSMIDNGGWNVNGHFSHEAYAAFSWYGVILGSIISAIVNVFICFFFRNQSKTPLNIAFYTFYAMSFVTILTSFNYMLFNTQLIMIFVIYLISSQLVRIK